MKTEFRWFVLVALLAVCLQMSRSYQLEQARRLSYQDTRTEFNIIGCPSLSNIIPHTII